MPTHEFTDLSLYVVDGVTFILAMLALALMAKLAQPLVYRLALVKQRRASEAPVR